MEFQWPPGEYVFDSSPQPSVHSPAEQTSPSHMDERVVRLRNVAPSAAPTVPTDKWYPIRSLKRYQPSLSNRPYLPAQRRWTSSEVEVARHQPPHVHITKRFHARTTSVTRRERVTDVSLLESPILQDSGPAASCSSTAARGIFTRICSSSPLSDESGSTNTARYETLLSPPCCRMRVLLHGPFSSSFSARDRLEDPCDTAAGDTTFGFSALIYRDLPDLLPLSLAREAS